MEENERLVSELWIDKLARITRMEKLGRIIFKREKMGAYLFVMIFGLLSQLLLFISHYIRQIKPLMIGINGIINVFGMIIGVYVIHKIDEKFNWTLKNIYINNKENLKTLKINKCRYITYIIGILAYSAWYVPNALPRINKIGFLPMILNTSLMYIITIPLTAGIISYLLYIHLIFSFKITYLGIEIDFSDPYKKAGMENIGELYLLNSELYFFLITLFSIRYIIVHSIHLEMMNMSNLTLLMNLILWIFGIIIFFAPQLWIHRYMKKRKKEKIKQIYEEMEKDIGNCNECFPEVFPDDPDEMVQYMHNYLKLDMAHSQSEYPFDMANIRELFSIAIIPLVLELFKYTLF